MKPSRHISILATRIRNDPLAVILANPGLAPCQLDLGMHLLIADYKEELTERRRHHGVARPEVAPAAEYFIRANGLRDRTLTEEPLKNRMKSRVWSKAEHLVHRRFARCPVYCPVNPDGTNPNWSAISRLPWSFLESGSPITATDILFGQSKMTGTANPG